MFIYFCCDYQEAAARAEVEGEWARWQEEIDRQKALREKARERKYQEGMKRWYESEKAKYEEAQAQTKKSADAKQAAREEEERAEMWSNKQQRALDTAIANHPGESYSSTHERSAKVV